MKRKISAIISADAVGYSRRMSVDEYTTVRTIRAHRELMTRIVRARNGRVVDAVGDNLLAEFASAVDAVVAAMAMQEELTKANAEMPEEQRLPFRMGIHLGELLQEGNQIFGDGINIAARLEGLAAVGGICVSEAIVEQFKGEMKSIFEDAGEHELKNIPYPVRTFAIRAQATIPEELASIMRESVFESRPAIAVMPFENRSDDAEMGYLGDGIVEDLIAQLSAFRLFPVISRSSTASYKGTQVNTRQVSEELGARYIVEGNVRKSGKRIRITVSLADGTTGHQMHSERYECEEGNLFALQDQIVLTLVGVIQPIVGLAERQRAMAKPTTDLDAWDCLQRASSHIYDIHAKADIDQALDLLLQALERDPSFTTAKALEAECYSLYVVFQWADDPEAMLRKAVQTAEQAISLGPNGPTAHVALGRACSLSKEIARGMQAFNRAIELNPSMTLAYQGVAFAIVTEDPEESIEIINKILRLSPRDPLRHIFYHQIAVAHLLLERYEQVEEWELKAISLKPDMPQNYRILAAAYGYMGETGKARANLEKMLEMAPQFTLSSYRATNSEKLTRVCEEGWRLADWEFPAS